MSNSEEPPIHAPTEGATDDKRITYLPEPFHWFDEGVVPFNVADRVTLVTAARWADRYAVSRSLFPLDHQEGMLPVDSLARPAFMAALITSWARMPEAIITLFRGGEALLDQSQGIPGVLRLATAEFAALQNAWKEQGLPTDLYYPAHEQRIVIEPAKRYGGVVRVKRSYSPRRWVAHPQAQGEPDPIPSEEARQRAFEQERSRFKDALLLRILELSEPGRSRTPQERAEGEALGRLNMLPGI